MEPAVKQLRCTYHRPTQRYIWKGAARQGNRRVLLSDPRVDCITMNNVARWGAWGPWSSWTQCSRECGTGEKIRQRRRVCVGGVMGENDQCPHNGNVQLEYGGCDNQCGKCNKFLARVYPSQTCRLQCYAIRTLIQQIRVLPKTFRPALSFRRHNSPGLLSY